MPTTTTTPSSPSSPSAPATQHPLLLPLHLLTILLTLLLPPTTPHRRPLSLLLITLTYLPTLLLPASTHLPTAYGVATLWSFTLRVLTIHLFSAPNPEAAHRRLYLQNNPTSPSTPGDAAANSPGKKLPWAISLLLSPREIGWSSPRPRPSPSRPPPYTTRPEYARWAIKRLATIYILMDLSRTYYLTNPGMYIHPQDPPPPITPPGLRGVCDTILAALANGAQSWGFMESQYILLSLPFVFLLPLLPGGGGFYTDPARAWPPLFGHLGGGYTLGYFWGRVWHQLLRGTLVGWGDAIFGSTRGREGGGRGSRAGRVLLGFGLSGLGHAGAVWVASGGRVKGGDSLRFFWGQGAAVVGEGWVLAIYQGVTGRGGSEGGAYTEGEKRWGRRLGFLWVGGWLVYSSAWQAGDMRRLGLAREGEPVPWSLVRWGVGWPQKMV